MVIIQQRGAILKLRHRSVDLGHIPDLKYLPKSTFSPKKCLSSFKGLPPNQLPCAVYAKVLARSHENINANTYLKLQRKS